MKNWQVVIYRFCQLISYHSTNCNGLQDFVKMIECPTVNVIDCTFTAWDCVRDCYPRFTVDIPEHQDTAFVRILKAVNRHDDIRMYADEFLFLSE